MIKGLDDTICAVATGKGGAIAVVRMSGAKAHAIAMEVFRSKMVKNNRLEPSRAYVGEIWNNDRLLDKVLLTAFANPNSYTGEDTVEISCHASSFIQKKILELLVSRGARLAERGEFTLRAFLNGKIDLSQAEAVADLIASTSDKSHATALQQMRGGFSSKIKSLRDKLLHFATLIELELDFGEEDVEFADRSELNQLLHEVAEEVNRLLKSFRLGNAINKGIPVAIVGKPNVGKSTLLNALVQEERAIVSDIPGTTRDTVEDVINIGGLAFRFIDTAGLRETADEVEAVGIDRAYKAAEKADVILYLTDAAVENCVEVAVKEIETFVKNADKQVAIVVNKIDTCSATPQQECKYPVFYISAKQQTNLTLLTDYLQGIADAIDVDSDFIVTNVRHFESLQKARDLITDIETGLASDLPIDMLSTDIKLVLETLGTITGEVTNDDILSNVFSHFCIGK